LGVDSAGVIIRNFSQKRRVAFNTAGAVVQFAITCKVRKH